MIQVLEELYAYRTMLWSSVRKSLVTRYRGSFFGFFWTFLNPLLQLVVYAMVFSAIMRVDIENYHMYLFVAFIPWFFTATSIQASSSCVLCESNMIQKIYFPRMILPISAVSAALVNMLLSMLVVFAALLFSGIGLSVYVWALPIIIGIHLIFVLGMALIFSAVTVYLRDLQHILDIIVMAWFYLTPIVYPPSMIPEKFQFLLYVNPMSGIIESYRNILFYKCMPDFSTVALALIAGLVMLVIGTLIFQWLQKGFAEEL